MTDSRDLHSVDLPLPNIYFVTVAHGATTLNLYLAADFNGSAIAKVQRLCVDQHHFRPVRSNSVIKLRRMRLGDYLDNPDALRAAIDTAEQLNEHDTVAQLAKRPTQVLKALEQTRGGPVLDVEAVEKALGEALRSVA